MILHAGLIALRYQEIWRGVLLQGPSGAGKSDLALRALQKGFRLVADDRTLVFRSAGALFGRAPGALAGKLEVRGLGIGQRTPLPWVQIMLAVRCAASPEGLERWFENQTQSWLDVSVDTLDLWPFAASAPEKLIAAIEWLGTRREDGYQPPQP